MLATRQIVFGQDSHPSQAAGENGNTSLRERRLGSGRVGSGHPEFWRARVGILHPRAVYLLADISV